MRRFSIIFAAITLFAFGFACAEPKLEIVGGTTYDWGKVTPKQNPLKTEIKFKNTGGDSLKIKEVRPGCGCTNAPLDKYNLAPGEETILRVTLNVGSNSGDVTKLIRVTTNEVQNPETTIYLKANVVREISISPNYVTFPEMTIGIETKSNPVKITNASKSDVVLSGFQGSSNAIRIGAKNDVTLKPGETYDLFVFVKPEKKGAFNGSISFKTTHPDFSIIDIQCYGSVKESAIFLNK